MSITSAEGTLTLTEARRLLLEIGVVDGNVSLGLHASLVDEKGTAVVQRFSYKDRIEIAKSQLHLHAMSWSVSSSLSGLTRRVASLDKRTDALVVRNSSDFDRARKNNQLAVMFYSQKHYPLDGDVRRLEKFFDEGLRVFQIAYGGRDGANLAQDERLGAGGFDANRRYRAKYGISYTDFGLTNLGKRAVHKLNELHLLIDVSHCHEDTIDDVVAISRDPVIANHANAYARTPSDRNLSNVALRQIARSGGVIGVMPISYYVDTNRDGATVQDFIRHVDYLVDLLGIDHVGLSTDGFLNGWPETSSFYGGPLMSSYDRWAIVLVELSKIQKQNGSSKYAKKDFEKILGGNFLRVYKQVLPGARE